MDSRTLRIRDLKSKLEQSRNFVRSLINQCLEMEDGKYLSKSYWGKESLRVLESTKEG